MKAHRQEAELRRALREIRSALDAYRAFVREGGVLLAEGASGYPPSLDVLAEGVVDVRTQPPRRVYFLRSVPRDPFATDEALSNAQTWGLRSFASPPDAPRTGADVFDVHSRSQRVGLDGRPLSQW